MTYGHPPSPDKQAISSGFTLVELSIVLVIIGLIIGGILTGQDLINAAATRAQISQIEKYNAAVRTFQGKYGYLPGDIPNPYATQFGFIARGTLAGQGDGNGILEGSDGADYTGVWQTGETDMFWVDLSFASLIDGGFNTATPTQTTIPAGATVSNYFPAAKIGGGNFVVVDSGGYGGSLDSSYGDNNNYYTVAAVTSLGWAIHGNPGLSVIQAYNIDKKIDDGLPQSGNVIAANDFGGSNSFDFPPTIDGYILKWAAAPTYTEGCFGLAGWGACSITTVGPTTAATSGSSLTCYDNGGVAGPEKYSIEQSDGGALNCSLSFKFQ